MTEQFLDSQGRRCWADSSLAPVPPLVRAGPRSATDADRLAAGPYTGPDPVPMLDGPPIPLADLTRRLAPPITRALDADGSEFWLDANGLAWRADRTRVPELDGPPLERIGEPAKRAYTEGDLMRVELAKGELMRVPTPFGSAAFTESLRKCGERPDGTRPGYGDAPWHIPAVGGPPASPRALEVGAVVEALVELYRTELTGLARHSREIDRLTRREAIEDCARALGIAAEFEKAVGR